MSERYKALAFDIKQGKWLGFSSPVKTFICSDPEELVSMLDRIEQVVSEQGLWAVGWISYEASSALDDALETHPHGDFPLALFTLFSSADLLEELPVAPGEYLTDWEPSISQSDYEGAIAQIRRAIAAGDTYQVNFSMRLRSNSQVHPAGLFSSMVRNQRGAYSIYFDTARFVVCSASPELFFERDGDLIVSRPMKGTASRGCDPESDFALSTQLSSSDKERAENIMIVDMVRNDLSRVAERGSVAVKSLCAVETYPYVLQMTSEVSARSAVPLGQVVRALFPAASITGAPKPRTMRMIKELESSPRNIYTGTVGVLAPSGRAWFNVAIRTALIDRDACAVEYGVGSGIVWDSVGSAEYRECLVKASAITRKPDMSELFETVLWEPRSGFFLLERHISRMQRSALRLSIPFQESVLREKLLRLASTLDGQSNGQRIRMLLSRQGDVRCEVGELRPLPARYTIALAKYPVCSSNQSLYHKTTDRTLYDSAEPEIADSVDVILWNERGELTETRIANLVLEIDGVRYTPPVASGVLPGCYREELLARGVVRERVLLKGDLQRATRIRLINSLRREWDAQLLSVS
jgi:para-aminobenzoate synthetase/4-amino-4-deoxychorismate lyase